MGYYHISNLYKDQEILAFKRCFALEKIHGTSANVAYQNGQVTLSSGGEDAKRFATLFNLDKLKEKFASKFTPEDIIVVYGEAYGGRQQGMSKTYGKDLKFITFEVKIGEVYLAVPQAHELAIGLGFEFVDFVEIDTTLEAIDAERDKPSTQAKRNGIAEDKPREGIVLRPPFEVVLNNGKRVIAKHKREEFSERDGRPPDVDPSKREIMENAEQIALTWVTPMRLEHVIDALIQERDDKEIYIQDTGKIINLMIEDVTREAEGEIINNVHVRRAVGSQAAKLFKKKLESKLSA